VKNIPLINRFKKEISIAILLLVAVLFIAYITNNPSIIESIKKASLLSIFVIFIIYAIFLFANYLLIKVSVLPFIKNPNNIEIFLVSMYSTLVNFFGPLQSGPGYRAAYFKTKHGIKITKYAKITLLYYIFFMAFSVLMLFIGSGYVLALLPCIVVFGFVVYKKGFFMGFDSNIVSKISLLAITQLLLGVILFFFELYFIGAHPSLESSISYTGAANLSVIVGITPGAIGIREAFLVLSQSLHNIPSDQIIAANVLDRSVYFLFLIVLFLLSSGLHIKQKLGLKNGRSTQQQIPADSPTKIS